MLWQAVLKLIEITETSICIRMKLKQCLCLYWYEVERKWFLLAASCYDWFKFSAFVLGCAIARFSTFSTQCSATCGWHWHVSSKRGSAKSLKPDACSRFKTLTSGWLKLNLHAMELQRVCRPCFIPKISGHIFALTANRTLRTDKAAMGRFFRFQQSVVWNLHGSRLNLWLLYFNERCSRELFNCIFRSRLVWKSEFTNFGNNQKRFSCKSVASA